MIRCNRLSSCWWTSTRSEAQQSFLENFRAAFASNASQASHGLESPELQELARVMQDRGRDHQQPPDMVEMYDLQTKRLTFGHIPATSNFIENLTTKESSEEPVQDLVGWAERHHPNFQAKPHGPFYNWVKWMQVHLPPEEQDMYLKLDRVMYRENERSAFLKTAQWELSRLWHWQHQRVALGLPADVPLQQRLAAAAEMVAKELAAGTKAGMESGAESGTEVELGQGTTGAADVGAEGKAKGLVAGDSVSSASSESPSISEPSSRPTTLAEMLTQHKPAVTVPVDLPKVDPLLQRLHSLQSDDVRRLNRVLQDKRMLGTTLRRQQRKRKVAGNRGFESDLIEASSTHFIGQEVEAPESSALRPLSAREFTSQVQAGQPWLKTQLLDRTHLLQAAYQDYAAEARRKEAMKLRPFVLKDDGWRFEVNSRPPTRTLDLLCDYLELKYADAVMMKDMAFLTQLEMKGRQPVQVVQDFVDQRWENSSFSEVVQSEQAQHIPLSPQEIDDINQQATRLLRTNPIAYKELMNKLKGDGLISAQECYEAFAAADVRLRELNAARRQQIMDSKPVTDADRDVLLGVLQRRQSGQLSGSRSQAAAEKEWDQVTATWASSVPAMKEAAKRQLEELESGGATLTASQKQELLDWWDSPVSLPEACKLWQSYADSAATLNPPTLEEVLATARRVAAAQSAAASSSPTGVDPTLSSSSDVNPTPVSSIDASATSALDSDGNLASSSSIDASPLSTSDSDRNLTPSLPMDASAMLASNTDGNTTPSPSIDANLTSASISEVSPASASSSEGSTASASSSEVNSVASASGSHSARMDARLKELFDGFCAREGVESLTWEDAVAANRDVDVASSEQLLELFPECPSVDDLIYKHLDKVFFKDDDGALKERCMSESPDSVRLLYKAWKMELGNIHRRRMGLKARTASDSDSDDEINLEPEIKSSTSDPDSDSDSDSERISRWRSGSSSETSVTMVGQSELDNAWKSYVQQQSQLRSVTPDPLALEHRSAPPYPGASRLLTVEQTLMLHAGAGMFEHPLGRKVRVRVHVRELQKELGLSSEAAKLLIEVAGPQYDAKTGEFGVSCRRHTRREQNLRWCLQTIHRLVDECNRVHPSNSFSRVWKRTA